MTLDVDRLPVYADARAFRVLANQIASGSPRGQSDLAGQLRSAANSIVENIAEGAGEFAGAEKARFYRIARRSASECVGITDMYADMSVIDDVTAQEARKRLTSITAQLVRLIARFSESSGRQ